MSDIAIRVENLSKLYHLGAVHQRPDTLRDALTGFLPRISRKGKEDSLNSPNSRQASDSDDLWALKDVSFEVKRGEVVGIIGRNGAGKSTLLKILSRITEPTNGRAEIHGRVGSLLEVGTGFHPELTGRENIFLNGAILGMHRHEIQRRFDEIVAFAEIERFLETPVKRYSSGMYVRLAFAVAAHLEPEILLVDEVLAVGDTAFQKKCLGKMGDVAKGGRTVLFVSHNMGAVRGLCSRALLLKDGAKHVDSSTAQAIEAYLSANGSRSAIWERQTPIPDRRGIYFTHASIIDSSGMVTDSVLQTHPFSVRLKVVAAGTHENAQIAIRFTNQEGIPVFTTANTDSVGDWIIIKEGIHDYEVTVPPDFLIPGSYDLLIGCSVPKVVLYDIIEDELRVTVTDMWNHATALRDDRLGVVSPQLVWKEAREYSAHQCQLARAPNEFK